MPVIEIIIIEMLKYRVINLIMITKDYQSRISVQARFPEMDIVIVDAFIHIKCQVAGPNSFKSKR